MKTIEPVRLANFNGADPEFGRAKDIQQLFGLKRGTLYNLLADRKVKGVLLRVRGEKSGVRLFDVASVREFIQSQMNNAKGKAAA